MNQFDVKTISTRWSWSKVLIINYKFSWIYNINVFGSLKYWLKDINTYLIISICNITLLTTRWKPIWKKSLSHTALTIMCSGKHATGKANGSLPNNIGLLSKPFQCPPPPLHRAASVTARLPPILERSQWDICTNILTKPLLSPTKISLGFKSMKGNLLPSCTCGQGEAGTRLAVYGEEEGVWGWL